MRASRVLFVAVLFLSLAGCSSRKTTGTVTVTGKVLELGSGTSDPLSGATVRVGCDLDGDGTLQAEEYKEGSTGSDGTFSVSAGTLDGKEISVRFSDASTNSTVRTLTAKAGDQSAYFLITLVKVDRLDCEAGSCVSPDRGLKVNGLDADFKVRGKTFNPVETPGAMPGGFIDSTGALLTSGVFATVDVEDGDGNPVTKLSKSATLRMRVPQDTWGETVDIQPGNSRIDVPMYAFDEAVGSFVRDGTGFYEDATGAEIPESQLPRLLDGTYTGVVFARAEVTHFSTWNVDWPATTQTCISGILLKADGQPAVGAQLEVEGLTYTGRSPDKATDNTGRYCVPVMRSEGAGEDFGKSGPGNGTPGEKQRVATIVRIGAEAWDLGEEDTPAVPGCDCTTNRTTTLSDANKLQAKDCTISGTVLGVDGNAAPMGTYVTATSVFDVPENAPQCPDCTGGGLADMAGGYTFKHQSYGQVRIEALYSRQVGDQTQMEQAEVYRRSCPSSPVDLRLRVKRRVVMTAVTVSGTTINWTPPEPVQAITILRGSAPLWLVTGTDANITPPVTIGQAPAGAFTVNPWPGGALQTDDQISITGNRTGEDGVDVMAIGTYTVP
ncbi:MAG: hypothetical protein AB1938_08705 [Myxococcota bacterium]